MTHSDKNNLNNDILLRNKITIPFYTSKQEYFNFYLITKKSNAKTFPM